MIGWSTVSNLECVTSDLVDAVSPLIEKGQLWVAHDDGNHCDEDGLLQILVEGGCLRLRLVPPPRTGDIPLFLKYLNDSLNLYLSDSIGEQELFDRIDYYGVMIQESLRQASELGDEDPEVKEISRLLHYLREVDPNNDEPYREVSFLPSYRMQRYKMVVHLITTLTESAPSLSEEDLRERNRFCEYLQTSSCGDTILMVDQSGLPLMTSSLEPFEREGAEIRLMVLGSGSAMRVEQGLQFIDCWYRKEMSAKQLAYCLKTIAKQIENVPIDWQISFYYFIGKLLDVAQYCDRQGLRLQGYYLDRRVRNLVDRLECLLLTPLVPQPD